MANNRRGNHYPRNQKNKYADNIINAQISSPTDEPISNKEQNSALKNREDKLNIQDAPKSRVASEKGLNEVIKSYLPAVATILAILVPLCGAIWWIQSIKYDLNQAKDDLKKNESKIELHSTKIEELEKLTFKNEITIEHIDENQKKYDEIINSINQKINIASP